MSPQFQRSSKKFISMKWSKSKPDVKALFCATKYSYIWHLTKNVLEYLYDNNNCRKFRTT